MEGGEEILRFVICAVTDGTKNRCWCIVSGHISNISSCIGAKFSSIGERVEQE